MLDKNYKKDEISSKKVPSKVYRSSFEITIDDVRNKAYGTLEDEIKDDLIGKAFIESTKPEPVESDINIFEELEKYEPIEETTPSKSTSDVDEIFGKLDNKKEEILGELDNKKEEILDEIDTKKTSINLLSDDYKIEEDHEFNEQPTSDVDLAKNLLEENEEEEKDSSDTEKLAKQLEEQKKKLAEINDLMDENEKVTKNKDDDNLDESELFNLIDSMYEKKDDE